MSAEQSLAYEGPATRRAPLASLGRILGRTGVTAVTLAVLMAAGFAWMYLLLPSLPLATIPCPFQAATGFDCPGCGLQSSFYNLLELDFRHMLMQNLLSPLLLPLFFYLILSWIGEAVFAVRFPQPVLSRSTLALSAVILLGYWVLRNIPSLGIW